MTHALEGPDSGPSPDAVPWLRPPTDDPVGDWLRGRTESTRRAYASDIEDFARRFGGAGREPTDVVRQWLLLDVGDAHAVAIAYRDALIEAGLSSATVARRLAALKSLSKLMRRIGRISWLLDVDPPKPEPRRDSRGPARDEFARLWKAARKAGDGPRARRDRAIVALLYGHALRRREVIGLDLADVELMNEPALWIKGKGQRERHRITLDPVVARHLEVWIVARGTDPGPLFRRVDRPGGGRLSGESVRLVLAGLSAAAGLARVVRPHGLRHASITEALALGITVPKVRRFSRHAKVETVMVYADAIEDDAASVASAVTRRLK